MDPLLPSFRRELRARAHHLHPIVSIGHHGLTPAVVHEIDVALTAHELVKVRVLGDDRREREALCVRVCAALDCAPVQRIGKLLVLWRARPAPDVAQPAAPERPRSPRRAGAAPKAAKPRETRPRRRRARGPAPIAPAGRVRERPSADTGRDAPRDAARRAISGTSRAASGRATAGVSGGASGKTPSGVSRAAAGKAPPGVPRATSPRRRRRLS